MNDGPLSFLQRTKAGVIQRSPSSGLLLACSFMSVLNLEIPLWSTLMSTDSLCIYNCICNCLPEVLALGQGTCTAMRRWRQLYWDKHWCLRQLWLLEQNTVAWVTQSADLFLTVWKAGKFRIQVPADLVPGEDLLPTSQTTTFLLCLRKAEGEHVSSLVFLLIKALIP